MLRKIVPLLVVAGLLLIALPGVTLAQGTTCASDVSVQADDWLSKLAERDLGAQTAYPAIVLATNMKHATDASYALIIDPNIIEVGQKLCIPSAADATTLNATKVLILNDNKGPGSGNPFWLTVENGAKEAAATWGGVVDLQIQSPTQESDVAGQISQLEDGLTRGVKALVLAATSSTGLNPTLDKYKAANVPVLTIDSGADSDVPLAFIGTNNQTGGSLQGKYVCDTLGAGVKVGLISGNLTAQSIADRTNGAKTALAACNAVIVRELSEPTHSIAGGQQLAEDILTSNPDVQALIAINDNQALGALQAVTTAAKEVMVIGYDANPDACQSVAADGLAATIAQAPANMGKFGVNWAMVAYTGNSAEIPKLIDTGTTLITKANAATCSGWMQSN